MTIAAAQLHTYVKGTYPRVRLSRSACRYTAGGSITQHSAFGSTSFDPGGYYSNANDILAPTDLSTIERKAYLDEIYFDLLAHRKEWSTRLLLWQVPDHYGHIHIDHYPAIVWPDKWCGQRVTPKWRFSDGLYMWTNNPMPENGLYNGSEEDEDMSFVALAAEEFDFWSDQNIIDTFDAGMYDDNADRVKFIAYWTGDARQDRTDDEKARLIADYRAHLWKRGT